MLFDGINLEQFDEVLARGGALLQQLLALDAAYGALVGRLGWVDMRA
jgi:hypothetical protein